MADMTIRIVGDASPLKKALGQAETSLSRFKSGMGNVGKTAAGVFGGISLAAGAKQAVGFLGDAVKAAQEDQKAQAILAQTLKNTVGARKGDIASVESWISKTQAATGIVDDELRPALGQLVRATGDVSKAQGLMKTAMDVSTATGKPLGTVAVALSKAYNGNVGALGKLGIATKDAHGKTLSFAQIQDKLKEKFGGATAAAANTAAGKMQILKARFGEVKESIGNALIPIIQKLVTWVLKITEFFQKHEGVAKAVAIVIGGVLVAAVAAYAASMATAAAATIAATWPILAIIAALAAVVIAIKYAWEHWETFRDVVRTVVKVVQGIVSGFIDFITALWQQFGDDIVRFAKRTWDAIRQVIEGALKIIRGVINVVMGLIHGDFSQVWDGIKQVFSGVWDAIKGIVGLAIANLKLVLTGAWQAIKFGIAAAWSGIVSFFEGLPGKIGRAFLTIADVLTAPFKSAFNAIAELWNNTIGKLHFKTPSWLGPLGNKEFSMPTLPTFGGGNSGNVTYARGQRAPTFDKGGIVPGRLGAPMLALVHGGETILPTHKTGGLGYSINIAIYNPTGNGDQIADELVKSLKSGRNAAEFRRVMAGV